MHRWGMDDFMSGYMSACTHAFQEISGIINLEIGREEQNGIDAKKRPRDVLSTFHLRPAKIPNQRLTSHIRTPMHGCVCKYEVMQRCR